MTAYMTAERGPRPDSLNLRRLPNNTEFRLPERIIEPRQNPVNFQGNTFLIVDAEIKTFRLLIIFQEGNTRILPLTFGKSYLLEDLNIKIRGRNTYEGIRFNFEQNSTPPSKFGL